MSNHGKRFFENLAWLFGDRVVRLLVGAFMSVWMARYLQPALFGQLSFALAVSVVLAPVTTLGLQSVVVRELALGRISARRLVGVGFRAQLLSAFLSVGVACVFAGAASSFGSQEFWVVTIVALTLFPKAADSFRYVFESNGSFRYPVIADSAGFLLSTIVRILLIVFEAPLIAFAWALVFEAGTGGVLLYVFYRRQARSEPGTGDRRILKGLLQTSWPLMLAATAAALYTRIDQIMLNFFLGNEAVGLFAAANRLIEAGFMFPGVAVLAANSMLLRSLKMDVALHRKQYRRVFFSMSAAAILVSILVTVFSHEIERLLYRDAFPGSGEVMAISIWALVFVVIGMVTNQWLISRNFTGYVGFRSGAGLLASVISNLILIPKYGIYGAAVSVVVGHGASTLSVLIFPKAREAFRV